MANEVPGTPRVEQRQERKEGSRLGVRSGLRTQQIERGDVRGERLRAAVRRKLREEVDKGGGVGAPDPVFITRRISELVESTAQEMNMGLTAQQRRVNEHRLVSDMLGLGPLDPLLADPTITDIMVSGPNRVYIERGNDIIKTDVHFDSNVHFLQIIDRIVSRVGRRVDEGSPIVDARLKDGSRVHVVIPPLSLAGAALTIRKFRENPLQVDELVKRGTATQDMIDFLASCVRARLNIVVSGGGGSGKTTTLNILSGFIPGNERIITIEDVAELQLRQRHVVSLETRPKNVEGKGEISIRSLVINSLRMRPDRIVVGECRGGEALDMLQAMNTGHDGSLTTVHANNPHDMLKRLETLVLLGEGRLPSRAIKEQIGAAIHMIVHQTRVRDGSRKISYITEVLGCDPDTGELSEQTIFQYRQTGIREDGVVQGEMGPTGIIPHCLAELKSRGEIIDPAIFDLSRVVKQGEEISEATGEVV